MVLQPCLPLRLVATTRDSVGYTLRTELDTCAILLAGANMQSSGSKPQEQLQLLKMNVRFISALEKLWLMIGNRPLRHQWRTLLKRTCGIEFPHHDSLASLPWRTISSLEHNFVTSSNIRKTSLQSLIGFSYDNRAFEPYLTFHTGLFCRVDSKFEGEVWENLDRSLMTIEVRYKPLLRIVSRSIVGLRMMSQQGI